MIRLDNINHKEALRYLGYRKTMIDDNINLLINECEEDLLRIIEPRFLFKKFNIIHKENAVCFTENNIKFTGNDIINHLAECESAVIFCSTLSSGVDKLLRNLQVTDMAKAVISDSLANAAIEQVCDETEKIIRNEYSGLFFTWRYSPGYGDFSLSIQPEFINVLNATKKIGLSVNSSLILTPEKSVTAVIGLSSKPISRKKLNCTECNLYENCSFRKSGNHCS